MPFLIRVSQSIPPAHKRKRGNFFYVLKYSVAYVTCSAIARAGKHIGKATLSSANSILSEPKWTICKYRKNIVVRFTVFTRTGIFLRIFYSNNLVPHLLQVLALNHKHALSLHRLDGRGLRSAILSAARGRTVNEENPTL